MERDRFKAKFVLGNEVMEVKGYDAFDIINKIYPQMQQAMESEKTSSDNNDKAMSKIMSDWNYKDFTDPGDMHRFDRFDFNFTFGRYACLEWSQIAND